MKTILKALLIISAVFVFCLATSAQTATPDEAQRASLVNALERAQAEVKAGRKYVDALNSQIESKEKIIKAQKDKDALSSAAVAGLQAEIANLKSAIGEAGQALEARRVEVLTLKSYLEKTRTKLHHARAWAKYLAAAAGVLLVIVIVK